MKNWAFMTMATAAILTLGFAGVSSAQTVTTYSDQVLSSSGTTDSGDFGDLYDLTQGDIILSFTYDGNGLVDDFGGAAHAWAELGVQSRVFSWNPLSVPLLAGQDIPVGTVEISNDGSYLYVTYQLEAGWCMTESHLAVATEVKDIPQTKQNNPIPGHFANGDVYDPCVTTDTFMILLSDIPADADETLYIAAHAAVQLMDCQVLAEAPYGPFAIVDSQQGLRKDGSAVRPGRSEPSAVLTWDTNRLETDFFSLGFGGGIVVEFDCCIRNGEGPDVLVVEDTWGSYPSETAGVYASADGENWLYLGEANNATRDTTYDWQTVSQFDLGELECARFIKIIDTTDSGPLPQDADGFDLNTIQALQDCVECIPIQFETAWGDGTRFTERGNWATYITYAPEWVLAGVWLATDYDWNAYTFDPNPIQDIDDKLILQKVSGQDEGAYDLPATPPNKWANHRIWFDRDGVDQWQAQNPLAVDGGTFNTDGIYNIEITLCATSDTTGTAYMTINGLDQGFETDGNWQTMELSPAGMTWTGDMKNLFVFYWLYGYGATHSVIFSDITVTQQTP
jgi:hypothetical protein